MRIIVLKFCSYLQQFSLDGEVYPYRLGIAPVHSGGWNWTILAQSSAHPTLYVRFRDEAIGSCG